MRSINYADSATQTYPFTLVVFYVTPLSFSFLLSSILPPELSPLPDLAPAFASSLRIPSLSYLSSSTRWPLHLRRLQYPPATQTTLHFEILHGRCNERSYRDYNAVTSTLHCDSGRPDLRLPFYYRRSIPLYRCNCAAYGWFSVFSGNNPKMWRLREISYAIVNYNTITCFYRGRRNFATGFARTALFLTPASCGVIQFAIAMNFKHVFACRKIFPWIIWHLRTQNASGIIRIHFLIFTFVLQFDFTRA